MSITVGKRVARLRVSRGDSLRDSAARTGVSHTTIARIEKGEVTGSLDSTLRSIASGYGVPVEFLLGEQEPWSEFQRILAGLTAEQRTQLTTAPRASRIRMVVDFLAFSYPGIFTLESLAEASRLTAEHLHQVLTAEQEVDADSLTRLANGLQRMCGIDPSWLAWGGLSEKAEGETSAAQAQAMGRYLTAVERAAANGIDPSLLEMAVDMLALQGRHMARVAAGSQLRQERVPTSAPTAT